ncbi:hypothetical protein FACS189429_7750 [Bacteroidia bacterium]|nr:hypothetical protein FACS189429_7750 [Bacteroidia bacterium]
MKEIKRINDIVFFTFIDDDIFYATQDSLYCNYKLYLSLIENRLMELSKYNGCYCLLFTSGNGYLAYKNQKLCNRIA